MGIRSELTATQDRNEALATVVEALDRLRYGVIQLTVHDGKLMQVDVTERRRFAG
jgi:hypothetical protein